jgi:single-strand DNA-binding protein
MYKLSGTVKEIFDEQIFDSGFNKREFVVTMKSGRFDQEIKLECVKDKVELVNKLKKGDKVSVSFDLRGREWKGSYFVNLNAWKIESNGGSMGNGSEDEPTSPDFDPADEILDEEPPF